MTMSENPFQSPVDPSAALSREEAIVAEGILTARDLRAAYLLQMLSRQSVAILLIGGIVGSLLLAVGRPEFARIDSIAAYAVVIWLATLITISRLYYVFPYWRQSRRRLSAAPERQRITLSDAGLRSEAAGADVLLPWSQMARVRANRRIITIYARTGRLIFLPAHFFDSEADYRAARRKIDEGIRFAASAPAWETKPSPPEPPADEETIVVAGELTWGELLHGYWHLLRWQILALTLSASLFAAIGAGLGLASWLLLEPDPALIPAALLPLLISALLVFIMALYYRAIRQVYLTQAAGVDRTWQITRRQLNETTPLERACIPWSEITKLVEREERLILIQQRRDVHILPRRFFASEAQWRQAVEWGRAGMCGEAPYQRHLEM